MNAWVMLLRGINVGGHGKLPMADLKRLLETLGARDVTTYIQSGNVVLTGGFEAAAFANEVSAEIERSHRFRPKILLLDAKTYRETVAAFPYDAAFDAPKTGHVWFCAEPPRPDIDRIDALKGSTESYALGPRAFYLHAPDGIGRSKLAERVERHLGVAATARNLNTCVKLVEMLDALDDG